jgi:hypothetical protein
VKTTTYGRPRIWRTAEQAKAYQNGTGDWHDGRDASDNFYPHDDELATWWLLGWYEADGDTSVRQQLRFRHLLT